MNKTTAIGLAILVILVNAFVGHFFAPSGIILTPIVLTVASLLITFGTKDINVVWLSILTFLIVSTNDVLIKLYSGGLHDSEGLGWIHMLLFIGLVPTFAILLTVIFKRKDESFANRIMAVLLFPILVMIHLQLFGNLGLG
jgi:hypothetical protein